MQPGAQPADTQCWLRRKEGVCTSNRDPQSRGRGKAGRAEHCEPRETETPIKGAFGEAEARGSTFKFNLATWGECVSE